MPSDLGDRLAAQGARLSLFVEHLCGRALRARVEPDDLVQEAFLRALARPVDAPPAEEGEAPLRRWLNGIARHVVLDVARALRAAKRDGREEPLARSSWSHSGRGERLHAGGPGPHTRVAAAEEEARLRAAYQRLSPDHRRVLGLRQFEGLSASETARRMARSEAAVHSLYRRALEAWGAEATR